MKDFFKTILLFSMILHPCISNADELKIKKCTINGITTYSNTGCPKDSKEVKIRDNKFGYNYYPQYSSSIGSSSAGSSSNYSSSSTGRRSVSKDIKTGPRGGKYYINSNGNKTYVKK